MRVGRFLSHTQTSSSRRLMNGYAGCGAYRALEPVAEVGRVGREHAVAEQAEHGLVLLLQQQLELCLVLVQVVEVAHSAQCSRALRASKAPRPGTSRPGATSSERARGRRRARAGADGGSAGLSRGSRPRRRGAGRGRESAGPGPARPPGRGRGGPRRRGAGRGAREPEEEVSTTGTPFRKRGLVEVPDGLGLDERGDGERARRRAPRRARRAPSGSSPRGRRGSRRARCRPSSRA